jgi:hypothetical protein
VAWPAGEAGQARAEGPHAQWLLCAAVTALRGQGTRSFTHSSRDDGRTAQRDRGARGHEARRASALR